MTEEEVKPVLMCISCKSTKIQRNAPDDYTCLEPNCHPGSMYYADVTYWWYKEHPEEAIKEFGEEI